MIKYLILLSFFVGCAPKGVNSCQFNTTIYGQVVKHKNLPLVIYIDYDFPSDFYQDLMDSVREINRDREYIQILKHDTSKSRNFTNELYLKSDWADDEREKQGVTNIWHIASGAIQESDVIINVDDYDYRNSGYSFRTLVTHELLHALGLQHQTDDPDGILYPYLGQYKSRSVTEREYKNLECAYGK